MPHCPQARLLDSASRHLSRTTAGSFQGGWEPAALTARPGELERLLQSSPAPGCRPQPRTPDHLSTGQWCPPQRAQGSLAPEMPKHSAGGMDAVPGRCQGRLGPRGHWCGSEDSPGEPVPAEPWGPEWERCCPALPPAQGCLVRLGCFPSSLQRQVNRPPSVSCLGDAEGRWGGEEQEQGPSRRLR